jgi:type II restriction/modification system DNA methylase subunit YeeA
MAFDQSKAFKKLEEIVEVKDKASFVFDFLLAFGSPKATITKLKNNYGSNSQLLDDAVSLKNKLYFMSVNDGNGLHQQLEQIKALPSISKDKIRIILVTDFQDVLAYDTKAKDLLDIEFIDLAKNYAFFLPLAGIEKFEIASEHPADVKASYKMGQLCDVLRRHNDIDDDEKRHAFNVFLTRLLFCFYAEDTGIFKENQMVSTIQNTTDKNGRDTKQFFEQFFKVLNLSEGSQERGQLPSHFSDFPYVNGGLFSKDLWVPEFTDKARRMIIEIGALEWDQINPDIFGSMFQAVIDPEQRGSLGQHYTSVPNIMKVIQPLFLDDLREELDKSRNSVKLLQTLLMRLQRIRIFDPACGSGNFLIIAYKELRLLEIDIFKALDELGNPAMYMSGIQLNQFYGIEIDDFAHEIAILSLWLTENQMNKVFEKEFGYLEPMLPLKESGNIAHGNALRLDWENVCPKVDRKGELEVYICGNPPFIGKKQRTPKQTDDMLELVSDIKGYKSLDYIACFFFKASKYITGNKNRASFVTTNSICQGEQAVFWRTVFSMGVRIKFGYQTFKWSNSARNAAAVHVMIIGLTDNKYIKDRFIFSTNESLVSKNKVLNINPYLVQGKDIVVEASNKPYCQVPSLVEGVTPLDGKEKGLRFSKDQVDGIIHKYPEMKSFFKLWINGDSMLNGRYEYCLWVNDDEWEKAKKVELIRDKIAKVRTFRLGSEYSSKFADKPWKMRETYIPSNCIVIPKTSSENRKYIPIGLLEDSVIANSSLFLEGDMFHFGVLTSHIHNDWMRTVAGRLKSDYRYSATLVYNTFPWPDVTDEQKSKIEKLAEEILLIREDYPEMTMAQKYNPDTMPAPLLEAHQTLDKAVEKLYRDKPFEDASERLAFLFKRYEELIAKEQANA